MPILNNWIKPLKLSKGRRGDDTGRSAREKIAREQEVNLSRRKSQLESSEESS